MLNYSVAELRITLPAEQTAYNGSFDPNAALMIAKSSDKNTFNFLNVVSLVKVTTMFDCKRIVLNANEDIAGNGHIKFDNSNPDFFILSNESKSIVLKPQEGQDKIAAGTYYIAVKPGELTSGWSISFTSTDYNVYTRRANSRVTFNRGKIRSIGTFSTSGTWTHTSRGSKVQANQEVDLGLTITKEDGKKYRVIFANANLRATLTAILTTTGLAASETDYGDYFAWGAIEPWYTSYTIGFDSEGKPTVTSDGWKTGYDDGYVTAPTFTPEYEYGDFKMSDDPARQILGGDWQIPTYAIWYALVKMNNLTKKGFNSERKGYEFVNNGQALFLPAAGYVTGTLFKSVGSVGDYWSGTVGSEPSSLAYRLFFNRSDLSTGYLENRCYGFPVRPVRLVAIE